MSICKKCQKEFEGKFCPECGTRVANGESNMKEKSKRNKKNVFIPIILFFLC